MRSRLCSANRPIAISAVAALMAVLSVTGVALAYHAAANGVRYAYQELWVGQGYHGIVRVSTWDYNVQSSVCAHGRKQDGTNKASGGCNYNTNKRESVFVDASPISAGYGYFGGATATSSRIYVYECGRADVAWCDL